MVVCGFTVLGRKDMVRHWKWWMWKIFRGTWSSGTVHQGMNRNIFTREYRMSSLNSDNPEDYRSSTGTSQKAVHGSNNTPKWDSAFTQKSPECLLFMLIDPSCGHFLFCLSPTPTVSLQSEETSWFHCIFLTLSGEGVISVLPIQTPLWLECLAFRLGGLTFQQGRSGRGWYLLGLLALISFGL